MRYLLLGRLRALHLGGWSIKKSWATNLVLTLLAGGSIDDRRAAYNVSRRTLCDLYITSFQTLQRDWKRVCNLFTESGARFFLVIDEAHYIKQLDGAWASAVLERGPARNSPLCADGHSVPANLRRRVQLIRCALAADSAPQTGGSH